jgi:hypothetical protein
MSSSSSSGESQAVAEADLDAAKKAVPPNDAMILMYGGMVGGFAQLLAELIADARQAKPGNNHPIFFSYFVSILIFFLL